MVNCPKCGSDADAPVKTWPLLLENSRKGEKPQCVGIFECPNCKARFRSVVKTETRSKETTSIKNMVERIKGIQRELMQTLVNLREKIRTLETERASLMVEIVRLRKAAESKASALETEISMLRSEAKSLRDLLGYKEEEKQLE